jgi:Raf kinase inhibitor-like YbhB/YbcL family protein
MPDVKTACSFALALVVALTVGFTFGGVSRFALSSSAFRANGKIPARYTCRGSDARPPLAWTAPPARTRSLVLIVDDPDAPDGGAFTHWLAWNIGPRARSLAPKTRPPRQGRNDAGRVGWTGPCPPAGTGLHHYAFRLYALNVRLALPQGANRGQVDRALRGHVLRVARLVGTFPVAA